MEEYKEEKKNWAAFFQRMGTPDNKERFSTLLINLKLSSPSDLALLTIGDLEILLPGAENYYLRTLIQSSGILLTPKEDSPATTATPIHISKTASTQTGTDILYTVKKVSWEDVKEANIRVYGKDGKQVARPSHSSDRTTEGCIKKINSNFAGSLTSMFINPIQLCYNQIDPVAPSEPGYPQSLKQQFHIIGSKSDNRSNSGSFDTRRDNFGKRITRSINSADLTNELVYERHIIAKYLAVIERPSEINDMNFLNERGNSELDTGPLENIYSGMLQPDCMLGFDYGESSYICFISEHKPMSGKGGDNISDIPKLMFEAACELHYQMDCIDIEADTPVRVPSVVVGLFTGLLFRIYLGTITEVTIKGKAKRKVHIQEIVSLFLGKPRNHLIIFDILNHIQQFIIIWHKSWEILLTASPTTTSLTDTPSKDNEQPTTRRKKGGNKHSDALSSKTSADNGTAVVLETLYIEDGSFVEIVKHSKYGICVRKYSYTNHNEFTFLNMLGGKHGVVTFLGLEGGWLYLEWIDYESRHWNPKNQQELKMFVKQLLIALDHCHRNNVIHGDIKHSNVLVSRTSAVTLIDFGLARHCGPDEKTHSHGGTKGYEPPEKYRTQKSDMWSLGIIILNMLFPTSTTNVEHALKRVRRLKTGNKKLKLSCSELVDFLDKVLCKKEKNRMSSLEALSHPYVATFKNTHCLTG
eukprot:TRINITY_DN17845_c0_g1_i1.p1 TRINITY_DN17845_c0_g1~~TRINITY_DN17845_c0_g1_i1.p1  ORF type:complete len:696 (-),score=98.51 TRINITY_DN17845_c0_g1_i1:79-2166(-)